MKDLGPLSIEEHLDYWREKYTSQNQSVWYLLEKYKKIDNNPDIYAEIVEDLENIFWS